MLASRGISSSAAELTQAFWRMSALRGGFNWSEQHTNLLAKMECGP